MANHEKAHQILNAVNPSDFRYYYGLEGARRAGYIGRQRSNESSKWLAATCVANRKRSADQKWRAEIVPQIARRQKTRNGWQQIMLHDAKCTPIPSGASIRAAGRKRSADPKWQAANLAATRATGRKIREATKRMAQQGKRLLNGATTTNKIVAMYQRGLSVSAIALAVGYGWHKHDNKVVHALLNRNFLFDFKHGDNSTPIWLACDIVKQDFHPDRAQRSDIRTSSAEIVRYSATFATPRPAQPLGDWIPLLTGPTSFLSRRYRQQRIRPSIAPNRRRVRCPSASSSQ